MNNIKYYSEYNMDSSINSIQSQYNSKDNKSIHKCYTWNCIVHYLILLNWIELKSLFIHKIINRYVLICVLKRIK